MFESEREVMDVVTMGVGVSRGTHESHLLINVQAGWREFLTH